MGLAEWTWGLYEKGELFLAVDEKLNKGFDEKQAECLMIVGLWCAHPDRNSRPSIRQAIQVLNFESAIPNLPAKMPVPIIPRFDPNANDILYEGDAAASVGAIEFNKINYLCRVGWATYAESVRLWDSNTGKLSDFTSRFSVTIDTQNSSTYGHGVAFFLAPVGSQIPPNIAGGFLGLFNTTTSDLSTNQIIMVEFDTFPNPEWDPSVVHVGINNNSIASAVYTPWNASFHSDDPADALITYNATTKNLSVSWSYKKTNNPKENSSLSYQIDLMKVLPEWVMVGFSAATGQNVERHTIQSWEFSSSFDIKETNGKNAKNTRIIVATSISAASITDDFERGAGPSRFAFQELVSATNNFANERKLGEGGFGTVYRVYLADLDIAVAVKKISRGSRQGKREYITEVKIISQLRHRHLVQLVGWCHDKGEFLLVYEFMPNGSLDSHLFDKKTLLTWTSRYKIAQGLASVLLYLHEEWEQCVLHRDIKSSDIMLDSSFNVKLGDFGLARLMDHELGGQTTRLVGTLGYMAPEYISTGRASKESDVFSFGVVALEIATGRKAIDPLKQDSQMSLVHWIWHLYESGEHLVAVDERLNAEFDRNQVECLIIVGLWCAHPDSSMRPSIRQAIQVLNLEAELPDLPKKMPVPVYVPTSSVSSSEPSITNSSLQFGR
ncbi:Concanavalin A-like lectin protein kinase family protein, putative [Theobroma cacao]|uniref:Concanavalin A-like lectin protein kinase family protein, putative n=1 Tax=Theobroma cacao TaxID=3641 RepID=A0A061DPJ1_THECC|nr:Concanavalin A-like lectin protein kinase family protein, putative [Theobroma cacao]